MNCPTCGTEMRLEVDDLGRWIYVCPADDTTVDGPEDAGALVDAGNDDPGRSARDGRAAYPAWLALQ